MIDDLHREAPVPGLQGLLDFLRRPYRWRVAQSVAGWGAIESEDQFGGKHEFDRLADAIADVRRWAQNADVEIWSVATGWSCSPPRGR